MPSRGNGSRSLGAHFAGRRVLVTGGSSGIGRAAALQLARAGADVAIAARGGDRLAAVLAELRAAAGGDGRRFAAVEMDVADPASARAGVDAAAAALGGLDVVVNSAGLALAAALGDTPEEAYRRLVDVNYLGTVYVTRAALAHLRGRPGAHVANVSSLAGIFGLYGYTAYAPTKFAVTGFSEALRQELRPLGIGVSVLFPPDTDTPQLAEENRTKPPETRAIAGTIPPLSAEAVAASLLDGIARGEFAIVPGWRARAVAFAARHAPALVRALTDRDVSRVRRGT